MKITILDPAMCCSTGVCGPDVDCRSERSVVKEQGAGRS
ncbi:MAG: arsenic metallochaperone ArsD family protein [Flavobacteriaceae bacterium]|nr:arsenic metallochaperone ArsD family protein [Flavobacteriaceae bacterium]